MDLLNANDRIEELRAKLREHTVYATATRRVGTLRTWMEHHVFAVWDFMSLLKSLQRDVSCVDVPWVPVARRGRGIPATATRFVQEIVLGEECDHLPDGRTLSHLDLYLSAMAEVGADTRPIERFLALLASGQAISLDDALREAGAPPGARRFVHHTLECATQEPLHARAAAFFCGREDLIPAMFPELVRALRDQGHACDELLLYLERHIELDGGAHGTLARDLVETLCDGNPERWRDAIRAAVSALQSRLELWNAIEAAAASDVMFAQPPAPSHP